MNNTRLRDSRRLVLAATLASAAPALGAAPPTWDLCGHQPPRAAPPLTAAGAGAETTVLTADEAQSVQQTLVTMTGNVAITRGAQRLDADTATYDKQTDVVDAAGNVQYRKQGLAIDADSAHMTLEAHRGELDRARFEIPERHGRGTAAIARVIDQDVTEFARATYTTCDPGSDDWELRAGTVRLNQARGIGSARHVVVAFQQVPFLYLPYMSFPITDDRMSGFLTPSFRYSSGSGSEIALPYYFNIAPQYDATLTPQPISRRGTQLKGEFRYLTAHGHGQIDAEVLPSDALYGDDRSLYALRHLDRPLPRLSTEIDVRRVSDGDYFRELGNSLSTASVTHVEQRLDLRYQADAWDLAARLQGFQTVDETIPQSARPYTRLPQLQFSTRIPERSNRLNYAFTGEYVNFQRADRVSGDRVDLQPVASLPWSGTAAYLTPAVKLRYTGYALTDQAPGVARRQTRTVPILSLDGGVFLERDSRWGVRDYLQTLEPRLYYLYVPYREQSALPLFDSGAPDFNYTQLFKDNRYSGADRVGDANQVTLSVTTRLMEQASGRQRFAAGIGQIVYFDDREVALSGAAVETAQRSDLVAEASALLLPGLTTRADLRRDEADGKINKGAWQLNYQAGPRRVVNLSYRFLENTLEQTDLSLLWPLNRRWHVLGRRNYSVLDHQPLETLLGLEYQSCCWRLQLVSRRYVNNDAGGSNATVYLQLELKGLGSIGDRVESVLEHGILGYRP